MREQAESVDDILFGQPALAALNPVNIGGKGGQEDVD